MAERSRRMSGTFHPYFSIMGVNTRLSGINLITQADFRETSASHLGQ
jgi:hypothetical protein